jgi:hypothetical protein
MKTKTIVSIVLLLLSFSTLPSFAQKNSFSGEWKLNREKTSLGDSQLIMAGIKINMKNDSLYTTRVYENGNGEQYPFDENVTLDGKDCKIVIYEMPRTSKASLSNADGSITFESTTTFNGNNGEENLISKENWIVDSAGSLLTIKFTSKMSAGEFTGTLYFDKAK